MDPLARTLAPWLLLALLVAGCARPDESGDARANDGNATTTTPPPAGGRVAGFRIDGLSIAPAHGEDRPLHEDDAAVIRYTLVNPASEGGPSDFLVSYLLNGEVQDIHTIRLAPGASKDFEFRLDDLRDLKPIKVEVRAGSEKASAEATVAEWPRTRDRVDLGPMAVTVNRWLKNATDGWTDVNVTVERKEGEAGTYSMLRARILCADARGNVTTAGEARPNVPEPGMAAMTDIHLPGCPETLYGVELSAKDAQDRDIYTHILFVERGWRPPVTAAG
ncbi:MAG TPA: hypothetical protein VNX21_09055 [Candidatus Thermoplasmatota archaeon]|nr:hypothetical protein [Candidatus Thermoplasmatota archaeon]